jgi:hypothetical protein
MKSLFSIQIKQLKISIHFLFLLIFNLSYWLIFWNSTQFSAWTSKLNWFLSDRIIYFFQISLSAFLIFAVLICFIYQKKIKKQHQPVKENQLYTFEWLQTGYVLKSNLISLLFETRVQWLHPNQALFDVQINEKNEEICYFRHRGLIENIQRQVQVFDIFGFFQYTIVDSEAFSLKVYPQVDHSFEEELITSKEMGDDLFAMVKPQGDLLDFRTYRQGDPLNRVLWAQSLRSTDGQLIVRTPEASIKNRYDLCLFTHTTDETIVGILYALVEQFKTELDLHLYVNHLNDRYDDLSYIQEILVTHHHWIDHQTHQKQNDLSVFDQLEHEMIFFIPKDQKEIEFYFNANLKGLALIAVNVDEYDQYEKWLNTIHRPEQLNFKLIRTKYASHDIVR